MARPTKLTVDRHLTIVGWYASGQRQAVCAGLSGIGERTLDEWLRRGTEAEETIRAEIDTLPVEQRADVLRLSDEPAKVPDIVDELLPYVSIDNKGEKVWTQEAGVLGYADSPLTAVQLLLVPESEHAFLRLRRAITRASAHAEAAIIAKWREAATGLESVETTTTEEYDKDGELVGRKVITRSKVEVDWRAGVRMLEAREPTHYRPLRAADAPAPETSSTGEPQGLEDEQAAAYRALSKINDQVAAKRAEKQAEREAAEAEEASS